MTEKTIKVESYFGEKEINKKEFEKRWFGWAVQFGNLCYESEDWRKYETVLEWAKELSKKSFDRSLEREETKCHYQ